MYMWFLDAENYSSLHIVLNVSVASKVEMNFLFPSQLSGTVPTEIKLWKLKLLKIFIEMKW